MSSGKQHRCASRLIPLLALAAFAVATPAAQAASPAHYYLNGLGPAARAAAGEKIATIEWGTLSLINLSTGVKTVCRYVITADEENPEPGGASGPAGVSEVQSLGAYDCEYYESQESCFPNTLLVGPASYVSVFAEGAEAPFPQTGTATMFAASSEEPLAASGTNLRWKGRLVEEAGKVRQETEKIRLDLICHIQSGITVPNRNERGEPEYESQVAEPLKGTLKPLAKTHCCTPQSPPELEFDARSGTLKNEKGQEVKIEGSLKTLGYGGEEVINSKIG